MLETTIITLVGHLCLPPRLLPCMLHVAPAWRVVTVPHLSSLDDFPALGHRHCALSQEGARKRGKPIPLLPLISKVLEKVIHDQLQTFLTEIIFYTAISQVSENFTLLTLAAHT